MLEDPGDYRFVRLSSNAASVRLSDRGEGIKFFTMRLNTLTKRTAWKDAVSIWDEHPAAQERLSPCCCVDPQGQGQLVAELLACV